MRYFYCALAGFLAGGVTGLFGAGGGMVLVPLLSLLVRLSEEEIFPASVTIIAPICVVCLFMADPGSIPSWKEVLPYLIGSCIGGVATGLFGDRIPTVWLHRILGVFILWGGFRYLC